MPTCHNLCKYITICITLLIGLVFLIQSVAVVIDFDETQNYINNTCSGISNFSIRNWNVINRRATTVTTSLDSDLNITLYYPPVDVWIFWSESEAREWYDQLKTFIAENATFPCYVDYPQNVGITRHLSHIWFYYTLGAAMFILCGGCIIYCCFMRTNGQRNDYYMLN